VRHVGHLSRISSPQHVPKISYKFFPLHPLHISLLLKVTERDFNGKKIHRLNKVPYIIAGLLKIL